MPSPTAVAERAVARLVPLRPTTPSTTREPEVGVAVSLVAALFTAALTGFDGPADDRSHHQIARPEAPAGLEGPDDPDDRPPAAIAEAEAITEIAATRPPNVEFGIAEDEPPVEVEVGGSAPPDEDADDEFEIDVAAIADEGEALGERLAAEPAGVASTLEALVDAAEAFAVDPALVLSLAWHESRWRPSAVSHAGAVGVMQLLPGTADHVAAKVDDVEPPLDLRDPEDNALLGTAYLVRMLERYDGDERRALKAYNQGPNRLERTGPVPGAVAFADQVLATAEVLADAAEADTSDEDVVGAADIDRVGAGG